MFFEARLKNQKFGINVQEEKDLWIVDLTPAGKASIQYRISKVDYQQMDAAVSFIFKNSSYMIDVVGKGLEYTVYTRGSYRVIKLYNDEMILHESLKAGADIGEDSLVVAGMPGKIVKVMVKKGDQVAANSPLLVMEAMKMENEIRAKQPEKIKAVYVEDGQSVEAGTRLIAFERES